MKKGGKQHFLGMAASLAILLHLALFLVARPSEGQGRTAPQPPETRYLATARSAGANIRVEGSPVLFSLPSKVGFSGELLHADRHARLTLKQRKEPDAFLEINLAPPKASPGKFMVTAGETGAPEPPASTFQSLEKPTPTPRVLISPNLENRLVGGIALPPELGKKGDAWQVRAEVGISAQGEVLHVFLDQPLEPEALNLQVLQLLHGLRFKPGSKPAEGRIELYSPKPATPAKEAAP